MVSVKSSKQENPKLECLKLILFVFRFLSFWLESFFGTDKNKDTSPNTTKFANAIEITQKYNNGRFSVEYNQKLKQFDMSYKDGVWRTPRFFSFQFGAENTRVFHFSNISHHESHCLPDREHF